MKLFIQPQNVKIVAAIIKEAENFADDVIGTVDYADSNQSDKNKIRDDHFISKIGEEAVKIVFRKLGKAVTSPDYKIYRDKRKSWKEDLKIDNIPMAVKTQRRSTALIFGLSWTFQCSDTRSDPILQRPEAWVCFVEYDDLHGQECIVYPPRQIRELIFKPPRKQSLRGMKKVVYADDL